VIAAIHPSLRFAGLICALAGATQAMAQVPGAVSPAALAPEASAGPSIEEVVVTAEKRSSTIQKTPMSITALTGEQLRARGITTVDDALHAVPGVSLRSAGPGQTEIEMRGMASTGGNSPTVGFYLDDAPLTPPIDATNGKVIVDPDLYDLNRLEVLRGPQGTLYGSGSMGGTVRLLTNQPNLERFSGSINADTSGTVGGGPNGAGNLAVNLPIVEGKAAIRVVLTDKYNSGYIDRIVEEPFPLETNIGCAPAGTYGCARGNVLGGHVLADYRNVNWEHLQGARATLLMEPTDALKITTTAFYQGITQGGGNTYDDPPGAGGTLAHYQPANVKEPYSDKFALLSNTISYDLDFAQLTAATSYWSRLERNVQDTSEAYQDIYFLPNFLTSPTQSFLEKDPSHQVSEEIRLTSSTGGRLKWLAGLFFSDLGASYQAYSTVQQLCFLTVGGCAANPTGIEYIGKNPYHNRQYAVFGEVSYAITPTLTATAGLRYFDFRNNASFNSYGTFSATGNLTPTAGAVSASSTGVTPKFNVAYEPSSNLTVYGSVAKGFRPGGVNLPVPLTGPDSCVSSLQALGLSQSPLQYNSDSVWSYELGEKARFLGNALSINGDIFYIDWKNIQEPRLLPCGFNYTNNGGNAASYGPEVEVQYALGANFSLEAAGTYTHATLTSVVPTSGLSVGDRVLNIPLYTENTSLVYHVVPFDESVLTARISNTLVGPTRDTAFSYVDLKSYDLLNARAQLDRGPSSYALYINNLTNVHAELTANNTGISVNLPSVNRISTNPGLTIGLDYHYRF